MDDKKFDEIMHKYVSTRTRGKDADFGKLNEQKKVKTAKNFNSRLAWSAVSCVLLIAVALSIALPLTLPDNKNHLEGNIDDSDASIYEPDSSNPPDIQYCDEDELSLQLLESEDKLASEYNITATLPTIQNQAAGYILLRNRTNKNIVGALVEFSVYDDYFDIVRMYIVPENTVVTILSDYETLPLETIWNNCSVKYIIDYDEESECHNSRMFFSMGGYKYHLDAQYYGELSIEEVLDLIF